VTQEQHTVMLAKIKGEKISIEAKTADAFGFVRTRFG
jgi:hypothetical protein